MFSHKLHLLPLRRQLPILVPKRGYNRNVVHVTVCVAISIETRTHYSFFGYHYLAILRGPWNIANTFIFRTLQTSTGYAHPRRAAGQTRLISRAAAGNNLAAGIIATPSIENGAGLAIGLVAFGTIEQLVLVAHATVVRWDIFADYGDARI